MARRLTYIPDTLIDRTFREKIVLVGVLFPGVSEDELEQQLDELALLVDTAGADVVARIVQRRDAPDAATYLGSGKVKELRDVCLALDSDTVVFEDTLTPAQQRNLEKILGRTAIDRTAVILDIFAQNARTPEGKAPSRSRRLVAASIVCRDCVGPGARSPNRPVASGRAARARPNSRWIGGAWSSASTRYARNSNRSIEHARSSVKVATGGVTAK